MTQWLGYLLRGLEATEVFRSSEQPSLQSGSRWRPGMNTASPAYFSLSCQGPQKAVEEWPSGENLELPRLLSTHSLFCLAVPQSMCPEGKVW